MKNNTTKMALSSIGALGGLYFAFRGKKGFWGYVGFFILGSIAGNLAGTVVSAVIPSKKTTTADSEEPKNVKKPMSIPANYPTIES